MLIINFEGREAKGSSKGRYDETFASEDADSIKIPKLSNFCARNDSFSQLLCPIRAIKVYLKRTKNLRKNRNRLFIPTRGDHGINKSTISKWVKYTIKHAYKAISNNQIKLLKIRAHELRALSASWAYLNFIPLDEIIKAAVWSNSSIFASHYLRDFSSQTSNLNDIGPVVVAQKVVGGPTIRLLVIKISKKTILPNNSRRQLAKRY